MIKKSLFSLHSDIKVDYNFLITIVTLAFMINA